MQSPSFSARLKPAELAVLKSLAERWQTNKTEVIRRLLQWACEKENLNGEKKDEQPNS